MGEVRHIYDPTSTPEFAGYEKLRDQKNKINGTPLFTSTTPKGLDDSLQPDVVVGISQNSRSSGVLRRSAAIMARFGCSKVCYGKCVADNLRLILLIIAIFCGVALGFGLRQANLHKDPRKVMYVAFIGEIFLNMLKVVILPLIVSSLITGLAAMESQTSGKIGLRAVIYYLTTTLLAVVLGIVLVTTIQPGTYGGFQSESLKAPDTGEPTMTSDTFLDLIRNMFPPNIVGACFEQYRTALKPPEQKPANFSSNATEDIGLIAITSTTVPPNLTLSPFVIPDKLDYSDWKISGKFVSGINILGIVVFSIVFGITIGRVGPKGKPLADFFDALNEVTMKIVETIMWLAPVGVAFIVAGQILKVDDFNAMIQQLGMYFMTVLIGLFFHGLVLLPLVFVVFTRKNPFPFIAGASRAYATGFATSSSTATLPITIQCCEENNGVDPRITRFVLPIGATINMDGTALYEAVAAIFVAQTVGKQLDFGTIVAVSITATAAAIGAAGVPQAGLVTLVMVLDAVGLPAEFVGTILAVDWLLDRVRTTVNILGDVIGAGIVNHLCRGFLKELDEKEAKLKDRPNGIDGEENLDLHFNDDEKSGLPSKSARAGFERYLGRSQLPNMAVPFNFDDPGLLK